MIRQSSNRVCPTLDGIIKCAINAIENSKYNVSTFYLVGGFGGCRYIQQKVTIHHSLNTIFWDTIHS